MILPKFLNSSYSAFKDFSVLPSTATCAPEINRFLTIPFYKVLSPLLGEGSEEYVVRLALGFYIALSCWGPIIAGYFKSIENNCTLSQDKVKKFRKKIFNNLNKKDIKEIKTIDID